MGLVNGKQGPEEATGRFATRTELTQYVLRESVVTSMSRKELAKDCEVSVGTVQHIVKTGSKVEDERFLELKKRLLRKSDWKEVCV